MLAIKNLTKNILGEPLFKEVSFVLHKEDKVGLVGPNGCGKSTLLKIIINEIESDSGNIQLDNERIGYLSQELPFKSGETIESFLFASENPKAKIILEKVGLSDIPYNFSVNKLSGGQKTKLSLAKILLNNPSILLLDEPTNHLDLKGLEWLENFIRDFRGGVLIVSHDRRLLDNSVNKIFEIDSINHKFTEYFGGYTEYIMEKEKKLTKWENEYQQQQKEKQRIELWLTLKRQEAHVHPDPAKGRLIRSREKYLQREIYNKEIIRPKNQKKIIDLKLKGKTASSKLIVRVKDITKNFSNKTLFHEINFELRGKEHVLLIGENGTGKTTLLKIITGDLQPDNGEIKLGENVRFGYFAQEHEILDANKTVIDEFMSTERLLNSSKNPRSILGAFLFNGQDVFKKISTLSLGERVRLIFAKLTNQENELLLLDEPTNHLDVQSQEIIENALLNYKGAILIVSHDRYFFDKISINRTLTIKDGIIKENLV
ncbi:MAG: ribosomal protection-like ABC-F family protein [Candidatus Kuenenbacteria bacterium]